MVAGIDTTGCSFALLEKPNTGRAERGREGANRQTRPKELSEEFLYPSLLHHSHSRVPSYASSGAPTAEIKPHIRRKPHYFLTGERR